MNGFNLLEDLALCMDVTTLTPLPACGRTAYQKTIDKDLKV